MTPTTYRLWSDFEPLGTVTFHPDGRADERPVPGQEEDFAEMVEDFRDVHGHGSAGNESFAWNLDRQVGRRGWGEGFWIEKARPDGTFPYDDPEDED